MGPILLSLLLQKDAEDRQTLVLRASEMAGGKTALGRALGYRDGAFIGQMVRGKRPITEKTLRAMAGLRQLAPLFAELSAAADRTPAWANPQPRTEGADRPSVAQELSHQPFDTPPELPREKWMQATELPLRFVIAVPDGALVGRYEQGTRIVFERGAEPKPGKPILVQDAHGTRFVRIYGEERGTRWRAMATDPTYVTLENEADGLTLLACAIWIAA